jgi:hypothetical protein
VLNALHFMGYGAKMLSGFRAADPAIAAAYCAEGEVLVGWISAGTPKVALSPLKTIPASDVYSRF